MYFCEFPYCEYSTENKSQINFHHIKPKELIKDESVYNKICLCPICHTKIFIPESKNGIHSIKNDNSIIINRWVKSTLGLCLEYIDSNGDLQYYKRN